MSVVQRLRAVVAEQRIHGLRQEAALREVWCFAGPMVLGYSRLWGYAAVKLHLERPLRQTAKLGS